MTWEYVPWLVPIYTIGVLVTAAISYMEAPEDLVGRERLLRAVSRGLAWPWLAWRYFRAEKK